MKSLIMMDESEKMAPPPAPWIANDGEDQGQGQGLIMETHHDR